jgi:hypothetical protein
VSYLASVQQPEKTTAPLILPGQFLDSPELPLKNFLDQFSKTLSAAEHPSTRHNTTAARQLPPKLPDDIARAPTLFVWRDGHVLPLQPLYKGPYATLRRSLHLLTLHIGDKVSTLQLKPCNDPTVPPAQCSSQDQGSPTRCHPLPGFSPAGCHGGLQGTLRPAANGGTAPGTVSPSQLPGVFAHPAVFPAAAAARPGRDRRTDQTSRPLASRSGGSPVEVVTASSRTMTFLCICARYALRMHVGTPTT